MINTRRLLLIGYLLTETGGRGARAVWYDGELTLQMPGEGIRHQLWRVIEGKAIPQGQVHVPNPVTAAELSDLARRLAPGLDRLCPAPSIQ